MPTRRRMPERTAFRLRKVAESRSSGDVEQEYADDGRFQFAQQFERFAGVGGRDVEEHVHGDDRVAEQIEQYELEGAEDEQRKGAPERCAGFGGHGQQGHPDGARKEHQGDFAGPDDRLGAAQKEVRNEQHAEEHPVIGALVGEAGPEALYEVAKMLH